MAVATVPQPEYIFRGHPSAIHAATFFRSNTRLLTGDGDGWVVCWDTAIRRSAAVWRAHIGTILGLGAWGSDRVITHGKDNRLIVWQLGIEQEKHLSTILPVDGEEQERRQPWMLHVLDVNTMNFCAFAQSSAHPVEEVKENGTEEADGNSLPPLLIAVPNTLNSESVDIFRLPDARRLHTVPNAAGLKGGMVMTIRIFHHHDAHQLHVVAGYESGHVATSILDPATDTWSTIYLSNPHSQPVLSIDILPDQSAFFSSAADPLIAQHDLSLTPLPLINVRTTAAARILKTGHAGQQDLRVRSDGRVFATAGWDGRARVYSAKTMRELAVLKWHKLGCYAIAFAEVVSNQGNEDQANNESALSRTTGAHASVRRQRERRAERAHWLVVGSKDAKISLWDLY